MPEQPEYTPEDLDYDLTEGTGLFLTGVATVLDMPDENLSIIWDFINTMDGDEVRFTLMAGLLQAADLVRRYREGGCRCGTESG